MSLLVELKTDNDKITIDYLKGNNTSLASIANLQMALPSPIQLLQTFIPPDDRINTLHFQFHRNTPYFGNVHNISASLETENNNVLNSNLHNNIIIRH